MRAKDPAEKAVRDIRRRTRKQYSAEEKIRIVLEGLRGEDSIAALAAPGPSPGRVVTASARRHGWMRIPTVGLATPLALWPRQRGPTGR